MMDISHLYHDAAFGDPTLELDVKEQLKTREVNAREERNLQRMYESYERSKFICEKETAWERWKVGQSLHGIWERSPRLEKRLAMEKARIEALERSILYRNYRMNTNMSEVSFNSRSLTSVSLKPLQDQKKTHQGKQKKRDKTKKEGNENINSNVNPERGFLRQADFVRRSEHSIKTLAKLNWRQESRRRDHEKFKEELFFHSKPVIDKARVVLKGRSDVDIENLYSEFENILLHPARKPAHLNHSNKSFSKHQSPSSLSEKNVLRLMDSVERKPYASQLASVPEKSEFEGKKRSQTIEMEQGASALQSESMNSKIMGGRNSSETDNEDVFISNQSSLSGSNERLHGSENLRLPPIAENNPSHNTNSTNEKTESKTTHELNSSNFASSQHGSNSTSNIETNTNSPEQTDHTNHSDTFSPSLSVSQVIVEEEEEASMQEKVNENTKGEENVLPDVNNNIILHYNDLSSAKSNMSDKEDIGGYTMTCTTGLPQIWKQTEKPKEKPPVEVTASSIARKHRRKRKDRW